MTHSYGYRSGTRNKFAKPFRRHGAIRMTKILTKYQIGDYVDCLVDGAIHRGMPYQFYHGRTGRVFNVNPRSLGVVFTKEVRNRQQEKKVHVRLEHLRKSKCRQGFLDRIRVTDKQLRDIAEADKKKNPKARTPVAQRQQLVLKRQPVGPRGATLAKPTKIVFQNPDFYQEVY